MKTVCVIIEIRCLRTPDGKIWADAVFAYEFLSRYLMAFDHVRVVARVLDVTEVPANMKRADGEGVTFAPVPYYVGPVQFAKKAFAVKRAVQRAVSPDDAVILRIPSNLANWLMPVLQRRRQKYAVEVVGDPLDVYAPGAVKHPLRGFFRWWFHNRQVAQCAGAFAASYVTQYTLQRRYPCGGFTTNISSAELPEQAFVNSARALVADHNSPYRIVTVGSMEQMYKGYDVLIPAMSHVNNNGIKAQLTIIGNGRHRPDLEKLARETGQAENIHFCGQLTAGEAVRAELDKADLFVLPSRSEGLPRAMIEAMARGLPCIGSNAGGIPELLEAENMVDSGDISGLAGKIRDVLSSPGRMAQMSKRNLEIARQYHREILNEKRRVFYHHVRNC